MRTIILITLVASLWGYAGYLVGRLHEQRIIKVSYDVYESELNKFWGFYYKNDKGESYDTDTHARANESD